MKNLSLRAALIIAILIGLLLPAAINSLVLLTSQLEQSRAQNVRDHQRIADILVLGMQEPLWNLSPDAGRPLLDSVMSDERIIRATINDTTLGVFLSASKPERRTGHVHTLTRVVSKQGNNIGTVTVELDDGKEIAAIEQEQHLYVGAVILQVVISLGLILFLLNSRVVKPMAELSRQSLKLANRQLDEPFVWHRNDEIGQLGHNLETTRQSLHAMVETLEQKNLQLEADILSRRQIESALRVSQDRYQRLVESTQVIPWDANASEWRFTYIGSQAERLLGYPLTLWYHEAFLSNYLHPDDRHLAYQLFSEQSMNQELEFECRFLAKDGRTVWVLLMAASRGEGALRQLQGFMIDITARKQAELELEQYRHHLEETVEARTRALATANHELDTFSHSISQDLRGPLRTIDGYSQVLREDYSDKLDTSARNYLSRIRGAAQAMTTLIDDLLSLAKLNRSDVRRQSIDLSEISREIIEEFQLLQPDRQIELSIAPALVVDADPKLIRIALHNLLDNAWKFTVRQDHPRIDVGVTHVHGQSVYYVSDNGIGFDMAQAGKLFNPFQRLHSDYSGNGIGLALVQRVVNRHDGRIWAKSTPGEGATFYFTLPAAAVLQPPANQLIG
ncbi:Phytochrome-like protein cph1 [Andreprevotia sp. IGB-42]|uniref:sensor histidine kinase n=1 Tax=Andreprevotia sp. IGB-42 TaxID=2497473 RepID=UPI00135BD960|nr:ATP-binding protein [Andreprevotia sp. IGB-42]KAF0814928.1 Phytochrome-like protein cph1 [Andreprevotia sp. IGB-42]